MNQIEQTTQALIIVNYARREVEFTDEAAQVERFALRAAMAITVVNDAEDNQRAVEAQQAIQGAIKLFEAARVACKEPIIDLGRKIDAAAKQKKEDLNEEAMRLARIVGDFQTLELAKVRAAEAERKAEADRLEAERLAEVARIRLAEELRQVEALKAQREAELALAKARDGQAREAAEAAVLEQQRQAALAAAISHAELDKANERHAEAIAALPVVEPVRAKGQAVKEEWIIDSIREFELLKARPDLVRRIEFDMLAIKSDLGRGIKLPGVVAHKQVNAGVRTGPARPMIEV